jgi:hypothetical protein
MRDLSVYPSFEPHKLFSVGVNTICVCPLVADDMYDYFINQKVSMLSSVLCPEFASDGSTSFIKILHLPRVAPFTLMQKQIR